MTETHLSRQAHDRLREELEDLTTRGRVDIARAIEAARMLGDLSENGDYHAAKDAQGKMESRIRHIERVLATASIVDESAASDGTVVAGSVVSLRYEGDDDVERYLVGSIEERVEDVDVITPGSALGQALLGKKVGESVSYQTPTGATLQVEIVEVG
ncbi:MAG TPA: transcription elongation factor GreA [Acidimicrobiales bacterium]|nr:transcription elongation factor GreA [Acidimicrobiales bacterium]